MTITLAKIVWVALVVGWYLLRIPYERKSKNTPVAVDSMDRSEWIRLMISLTGLGIIPMVYVVSGLPTFANRAHVPWVAFIGVLVALCALVMFRLTHRALGRYWSVSLQMRENHKLIAVGIYTRIRHPMYSAFWLWAIAQALLLPNWIAGLSGIVGFGTLYLLRVGPEEAMMTSRFGDEYRAYMARTGRLTPWF